MPAKLHVLREIRDELKGTNQRLDRVEARVSGVEDSVSSLALRQTETEVRLATELVAVARAVTEVRDLLPSRLSGSAATKLL